MINYFIPVIVIIIIVYGIYKKVDIFDTFILGVKEGMRLSINLFPTIFTMIIAISIITDSNIINYVCNLLNNFFIKINFPSQVLPLALLRPISGSSSLVVLNDILAKHGTDTFIGRLASVMQGSTDTTIYIISMYFASIGIKKIDYSIITHGDEDHIGGSITLINNFQVKNVILNKGTFTDIEKELIKNLNKKKIPYQININKINLSNHTIYLLNNTKYNNENDNSIITYFTYQKYKFLYMGDASITTEDNLLENYNLNNISILKVGHHGSNTSSSKDFISQINPSISLISVGENNIYHHPNKEVTNNLSKSRIYRTDINNMVKLTINSKGILKVTTIT